MFKGQPKGLFALALANTGERFGYYTMLAIFLLFLQAKFGWEAKVATQVYSIFLAAVYFMPVLGGWLADRIGYGKCVVTGVVVMFLGYLALSIPTAANGMGVALMIGALLLIAVGTGLFKGNLQVMVGNLYDDPKYASKRDSAFSLFYVAINIGAMFAPSAANAISNWFLGDHGLIYKADIPALAHQTLDGVISADNAARLAGLQAQMPSADVLAMSPEAHVVQDRPTRKKWLADHLFYIETRRHLRRSLSHRLPFNADTLLLHTNYVALIAAITYSSVTSGWLLLGVSLASLVATLLLRLTIASKGLKHIGEEMPAWAVLPMELRVAWQNLYFMLRHFFSDKQNFIRK